MQYTLMRSNCKSESPWYVHAGSMPYSFEVASQCKTQLNRDPDPLSLTVQPLIPRGQAAPLSLVLLHCCCWGCVGCGCCRDVEYDMQGVAFFSSISPVSSFSISHPQPLRLSSGSLRPCRHREPVRLPFWLLARFVDALAPFACAVRCPHGSTMRFSTKSCVYSTHHSLHALNSLRSWLQRISLA